MLQTTLLLDSSAVMGLPCPELPPTKAIGLRPYLASFVTTYLSASPLAILSLLSMRDGTATTLCSFTTSEEALLEALETRYFMMPPSGMMSLENGLKLAAMRMGLKIDEATNNPSSVSTNPSKATATSANNGGNGGNSSSATAAASHHRKLSKEEEASMDRSDIECAMRSAMEADEAAEATALLGVKRGRGADDDLPPSALARNASSAASAAAASTNTANNSAAARSPVAQRHIIIVTGAVTILDPSNVFSIINLLKRNRVTIDVISLAGAPHILEEACRITRGTFMCPVNGGGDQLRKQLLSCARINKKKRSRDGDESAMNNNAVVKVEPEANSNRAAEEERNGDSDSFGGPVVIESLQRIAMRPSSSLVAIGFPICESDLLLGEAFIAANGDGNASASSSASVFRSALASSIVSLALGRPSQPLCSRCYNPVSVPSICKVCGLLACALPQIHKVLLTLDAEGEEAAGDGRGGGGDSPPAATKTAMGDVHRVVPTILPPTTLVATAVASDEANTNDDGIATAKILSQGAALRPRCACCGIVLKPSSVPSATIEAVLSNGASIGSNFVNANAVQCTGCGGVRCFDCEGYVRNTLKLCPTCVGN